MFDSFTMALLTEMWFVDLLIIWISVILLMYFYLTRNFNYWKSKGIPYDEPLPFFGNFKDVALLRTSVFEYFASVYKKTEGPYYGMFAFDEPHLLIKDPELIKSVLVKDFQYFSDRAITSNEEQDPVGSYNLFIIKNPEWKTLRVKLTPMFSSGKIKLMINLMNEVGQNLSKHIDDVNAKSLHLDAKEIAKKYTIDVICSCAFGIQSNCLTSENGHFWKTAEKIITFTFSRSIQFLTYFFAPSIVKIFRFKFFETSSAKFFTQIFNESIALREKTKISRNDLIDILIELKKQDPTMKDDKLVAQVLVFFLAGFEAASSAISFTLFELSLQPHLQTKLRTEIKSELAKNKGEFNYDSLKNMTYLDMVCSETLRKYVNLAFVGRRCTMDYKLPGSDIILDKGTSICISLFGLHYDSQYFPEPEKFDLERFSKENKHNYPFGVYMPFGEGPHNCIGARFGLMSAKVGLVNFLLNYEVEKTAETPTSIKFDPKGVFLSPIGGIPLKFKKINKCISVTT